MPTRDERAQSGVARSRAVGRGRGRPVLLTEYVDLYYISAFDVGRDVDVLKTFEDLLGMFKVGSRAVAILAAPIQLHAKLAGMGWVESGAPNPWVRVFLKVLGEVSEEVSNYAKCRGFIDASLLSREFLERLEYLRVILGSITLDLEGVSAGRLGGVSQLKGYVELMIHSNGVFVLTISIPVHGVRLSSTDVMRLRYLLEVEGVKVSIPSHVYSTWVGLKAGKGAILPRPVSVAVRARIWDIAEMFSAFIKYSVLRARGLSPKSASELESLVRNPWDVNYAVLFTEVLREERGAIELLKDYSTQIYVMLHGARKLSSREAVRRAIRRSYHYIPAHNVSQLTSGPLRRGNVTRVTVVMDEADTHVVAISRRYLGSTEVGLRLRLRHLTLIELINHLRQSLRVLEYQLTHKRFSELDELVRLRARFTRVLDLAENAYFMLDRDIKELFNHAVKALEVNKLMLSVERKSEALNYMIMTRYQDKINKMQLVLTVLFGIFGVPFFVFSYIEWYFDYVVPGRSPNFWPVTMITFLPMALIMVVTITLFIKWKREVFRWR